jgi:hypothetical protein
MSTTDDRPWERRRGESPLDAASRMTETNPPKGTFFPSANGPLYWTHAVAIAQVEQAAALNRIATALENLVFPPKGGQS